MEEGPTCSLAAQRGEHSTDLVLRTESWHENDIHGGHEHSRNLTKVFLSSHIDPFCHALSSTNGRLCPFHCPLHLEMFMKVMKRWWSRMRILSKHMILQ